MKDHSDEVWMVKFSPEGNYLASIAKNYEMIIWTFDIDTLRTTLVNYYKRLSNNRPNYNCRNTKKKRYTIKKLPVSAGVMILVE